MSKHWPSVSLGELIRLERRPVKVEPEKVYREIGIYCFGRGIFHKTPRTGFEVGDKDLFLMKDGDFILQVTFAWEGAIAIVQAAEDGMYGSTRYPTFRVDESRCVPQFLVARIEELAAQIHEARALRHQAAEEAEALPLAELSAVFRQQTERFGALRLDKLLTDAGYGSSEKCDSERMEGGSPVLRIPNVASERITLNDLKYARLGERDSQRLLLLEGDILVVRTNGSLALVGRSAVVPKLDESFAFASYMIRLRFDRNCVVPDFAQRMLQHLRVAEVLVDFARTTAGQYNVSLGRLRSAEIPVPPLVEQRRIVSELDALQAEVDALKDLQADTAAELDALLPAILDRAFKGEL